MNNLRFMGMKYWSECPKKNRVSRDFERKISSTCSTLAKNDGKSGFFTKLKNIFANSSGKKQINTSTSSISLHFIIFQQTRGMNILNG